MNPIQSIVEPRFNAVVDGIRDVSKIILILALRVAVLVKHAIFGQPRDGYLSPDTMVLSGAWLALVSREEREERLERETFYYDPRY